MNQLGKNIRSTASTCSSSSPQQSVRGSKDTHNSNIREHHAAVIARHVRMRNKSHLGYSCCFMRSQSSKSSSSTIILECTAIGCLLPGRVHLLLALSLYRVRRLSGNSKPTNPPIRASRLPPASQVRFSHLVFTSRGSFAYCPLDFFPCGSIDPRGFGL
ncbi:hypothetical protein BDW59DRAFT_141901 [Aspergillus cavernicola]|uniref:Uncharacterized protein n=1 Tax=Aspergillus cavernicola TaxID=176166 RepID=A0ABR4IPP0_9EURO